MADRYTVESEHAEDISTGQTFYPGDEAKGVDPKHPHDKAMIEDGRLAVKRSRPKQEAEDK